MDDEFDADADAAVAVNLSRAAACCCCCCCCFLLCRREAAGISIRVPDWTWSSLWDSVFTYLLLLYHL